MKLKPSEIRYSQDSINNVFDKRSTHAYRCIGATLDDLCDGLCTVDSIPNISVMTINGHWTSGDNRRLWVFRQLERLGKCETIPVQQTYSIPATKLTSVNGGVSIDVRNAGPGGNWYTKPDASRSSSSTPSLNYQTPSGFGISGNSPNIGHLAVQEQDGVTYMDPMKMKYTKIHISATFDDGRPLISLKESLRSGMTSARSVPPLDVLKAYGFYYVIDGDRRLNVFRDVRQNYDLGLLAKVKVTDMEDDEEDFVDTIRERYPNLQLFDILKMGDSVTVTC